MSTRVHGWCPTCKRTGACDHIQQRPQVAGCYAVAFTCPNPVVKGWHYCKDHLQKHNKPDKRERTKAAAPVLLTCLVCGEDFVSTGDLYCGGAGRCTDGIDVDALAVTLLKLELAQATAERLGIREGEQLHEFIARMHADHDADPAR